jgi:hypothetical protein
VKLGAFALLLLGGLVGVATPSVRAASTDDGGNTLSGIVGMPLFMTAQGAGANTLDEILPGPFALRGADSRSNTLDTGALAPWLDAPVSELTAWILGPSEIEKQVGESHTFHAGVNGAVGAVSYQWKRDTAAKAIEAIPGAQSATYTLVDIQIDDGGMYLCEVSDELTSVETPPARLIVLEHASLPARGGWWLAALLTAVGTATLRRTRTVKRICDS